ncbi:hypothetical protein IFM89_005008 [Coptis chinensis]|uniref:Uncharacterized protein n=1 Tax=Coptis chinensis TaxID=261450 RepID=A0A835HKU9_9MAGN|nr:hypothetical protein IFM89_005008 [Coptis chinensis]
MAFWGVEVKPGRLYTHGFDETRGRTEYYAFAHAFDEDGEVVFSVLGSRSVHLTVYYPGRGSAHNYGNEDDTYSNGEDLNKVDSERSSEEEKEYDDDFIDEESFAPSPVPKS